MALPTAEDVEAMYGGFVVGAPLDAADADLLRFVRTSAKLTKDAEASMYWARMKYMRIQMKKDALFRAGRPEKYDNCICLRQAGPGLCSAEEGGLFLTKDQKDRALDDFIFQRPRTEEEKKDAIANGRWEDQVDAFGLAELMDAFPTEEELQAFLNDAPPELHHKWRSRLTELTPQPSDSEDMNEEH